MNWAYYTISQLPTSNDLPSARTVAVMWHNTKNVKNIASEIKKK